MEKAVWHPESNLIQEIVRRVLCRLIGQKCLISTLPPLLTGVCTGTSPYISNDNLLGECAGTKSCISRAHC